MAPRDTSPKSSRPSFDDAARGVLRRNEEAKAPTVPDAIKGHGIVQHLDMKGPMGDMARQGVHEAQALKDRLAAMQATAKPAVKRERLSVEFTRKAGEVLEKSGANISSGPSAGRDRSDTDHSR